MKHLYTKLRNQIGREDGQGLVEYAMIVGLIAIGVFSLLSLMGTKVMAVFEIITGKLALIKAPGI